jgi:hemerythrin
MGHLLWTKELDTGIEVIDSQHRRIVDYINKLYDARLKKDIKAINDIIEGTVDYTMSHLSFEEALLEDAGYEFVRPHKKVHELFVRRVSEFQTRSKMGEDISEDLHNLLARWLFNHINNDDAAYVQSVKKYMQSVNSEKKKRGWLTKFFGSK